MSLPILIALMVGVAAVAVTPDRKTLPIGLAPHEHRLPREDAPISDPPTSTSRSLGEWELADAAVTLWSNPPYIAALAQRGNLTLLADGQSEKQWWQSWLTSHQIPTDRVSYMIVPTDSIWIRDYGPWYILDGEGQLGMVDTKYNRPRPNDDLVPGFLSRALGIPMYQPGLVHTGGNYYSDGHGNAFSSTLVYSENKSISQDEVRRRMLSYLGVERYTTSKLAPGLTIEHLDTFGKLVAPDTWVFSEFPVGSRYRTDSENMVKLLQTLTSPYGTPYKIHRLKMTTKSGGGGEDYRAYINSFISNQTLYYPTYGGQADEEAKRIYQAALPSYEIVGVDAEGTSWGDSVHCRSNNLYSRKTVFIFPSVKQVPSAASPGEIRAEIFPSPGGVIESAPRVHWKANGRPREDLVMEPLGGRLYRAELPAQPSGTKLSLYLSARDSLGVEKTAPWRAPHMTIDLEAH